MALYPGFPVRGDLLNALVAADAFLVPVTPQYLAVEGLLRKAALVATEGEVFKQVGSSAKPAPTKLDELLEKSAEDSGDGLTVAQRLRKQFRDNPDLYAEVSADDSNSIGRAL